MSASLIQSLAQHYLPPAQQETAKRLLAALAVDNDLPNAVVYGVYNSGKSSLLNSLTGHTATEYFVTRDIPETREIKKLEYQGICYIDTPGLDVNASDTAIANDGAFQADILLLVHRLSAGSIQQQDLQAIQKLVEAHKKPEYIFVVLTEAEIADDNSSLIEEITSQLQPLIHGCQPFLISNSMFKKGTTGNKPLLLQKSGIPVLQQALQTMAKQLTFALQQERESKIIILQEQLLDRITQKISELTTALKSEASNKEAYEQEFIQSVRLLQQKLASRV